MNTVELMKNKLEALLDNWYFMKTTVKARLEFEYDSCFADLESQLSDLKIECQNLQNKLNFNGSRANINFGNPAPSFREFESSKAKLMKDEDISQIYRMVAKRLHPDSYQYQNKAEKHWHGLQIAYRENNQNIIHYYGLLTNYNEQQSNEIDIINHISRATIAMERLLEKMPYLEPFCYEDKLRDQNFVDEKRNQLELKIEYYQQKKERLELLTGLRKYGNRIKVHKVN